MKHRTHKDFPSYRFYSDGRIKNKTTNHFIKVKPKMKLIDAKGKHVGVLIPQSSLANYFLTYIPGSPIRPCVLRLQYLRRGLKGNILRPLSIGLRKRQIGKPMMNLLGNIIYRWVVQVIYQVKVNPQVMAVQLLILIG